MDKQRLGVSLTKNTADRSDGVVFSFSFFCDCCGKEWASQIVPFINGGFSSIEHEEARALLWAHEHQVAFENANLEAHFYFSRCPVCGKMVCNDCFEAGDGKCTDCACAKSA